MKGSNKFKVFIALFVVIVLVMGSSYAVWRYYYNGTGVSSISSTDLSFRFLESNKDVISIDSGIPMTDKDGINQNDSGNVFDFEVKSKALASTDVKYVVSLEKLDIDSGKTALGDSDVKIYVEDFNGNTVLKPTKISDLDNYKLFEKLNRHSKSNSEISTKYKLKVWIDDSVDVFSLENKQYKFKINVKTDQQVQNKDQTYKLVYNLDGGSSTSAISDSSFKVGDQVTITSVVPVKEGYEFLGWSTKKNDSTFKYNAGDSVAFNDAYDGTVTLYAVWGLKSYNVNVVIKNGSVDGDSTKSVVYKNDVIFNLVPDADWALGSVTCTNNQSASIDNKVLTVKGVTKETTCTVNYRASVTTLFNDGTLIINESAKDRVSNISKHGKVVKDYNAIGDSASYVMTGKSSQPWKDERDNIKSVEIGHKITPTSTAYWFMGLNNMEKGDFTNLDTSNVTDMSYMFDGAGSEVKTFVMDLSKFNTSKVTNMTHVVSSVGYNATTFSIGDLSNWDVSKVTNMSSAFFNLGNSATTWNIGDLSNWNTSSVTNMYYMFYGAGANATRFELDLSKWDVSKVTSVWYMFGSAGSNSNEFILDLSGWDLSNLDRMTDMFTYAGSKATTWTVKIPSKTGTYTNTKEKWYGSSESAYAVPASGKYFTLGNNVSVVVQNGSLASGESTSKVVGDGGSTTFNLIPSDSNYKDATVSCTNNQIGTFKDNLLTISNVTSDTTCTVNYYRYSTVLYSDGTLILNENSDDRNNNITTHGTVTKEYDPMNESNSYVFSFDEDTGKIDVPWFSEAESITSIIVGSEMKPVSTANWFYNLENMESGNFVNLDTSSVTDMSHMFSYAGKKATFNLEGLSNWDTSNVTDMSCMFYTLVANATTWNIGDLSNWNTSSVTDMSFMFYLAGANATTWNIGDLSNWNTSSVTDMSFMFHLAGANATTWNIGNLSNWNTSNVINMDSMFLGAGENATTFTLDLSNWDTSQVILMNSMFFNAGYNSTTFNLIGLSSWNTSNVTDMSRMFSSAGYNATTWNIGDLSSWDTSKVENMSSMFSNPSYKVTDWNVGDLSNWNVSNVTDMSSMFSSVGLNSTVFTLDLSNWDISNVTNMSHMFDRTGYNANTFNFDLSNWNTSKVTSMESMFSSAGYKATTWIVKIPKVTGSLTNSTSKWYGSSSSVYAEPISSNNDKQFTLPVDVNVVVQDGSLADGETSSKNGWSGDNFSFNILPNDSNKTGFVSCTNGQIGTFSDNVLTVKNLSSSTTCTVTFDAVSTVLYEDGTLIFNEHGSNRDINITTHGSIAGEYAAYSDSNSYVFSSGTDRPWHDDINAITSVIVEGKIKPLSVNSWFQDFDILESADFSNLDTSEVTDMSFMFVDVGINAKSISLDLSSFNTSKVTDMKYMFQNFGASAEVINLDLSGWNTSNVENISYMFSDFAQKNNVSINIVGLDDWNVSNVTNMSYMFYGFGRDVTSYINIGDLSKWDTSNVEDMSYMFCDFGNDNTKIDSIGKLNIPYGVYLDSFVTSFAFVGDFYIDGSVSSDDSAFAGAATVDGSRINLYYDTNNSEAESVVDKYVSEYGTGSSYNGNIYKVATTDNKLTVNVAVQNGGLNDDSIKEVNYGSDVTYNVVPDSDVSYGSVTCENGTVGAIENNVLTLKNVKTNDTCVVSFNEEVLTVLYNDGTLVINELVSNIDEQINSHGLPQITFDPFTESNSYVFNSNSDVPWIGYTETINNVIIGSNISPLSTSYWFSSEPYLASGDFHNLDTSQTISMEAMFANSGNDTSVSSFKLNGFDMWNTSKVEDMSGMFYNVGINAQYFSISGLSKWNTSKVTNMKQMFSQTAKNALNLKLDLSNWNTLNVVNMVQMFKGFGSNSASYIDIGDLTNWDTSKVEDMSLMFSNFGNSKSKIKSIGMLSLPTDIIIDGIVAESVSFNGGFKFINDFIASDAEAFSNAATVRGSRIDLCYEYGSAAEVIIDEYISDYGPYSSFGGHIYRKVLNN